MLLSINQTEINEATLLIEIEDFIQSSINANRQPRSFYHNFRNLLLDFDQVYNPDFSYSCLIDLFCSLLYDYDLNRETSSSLYNLLRQTSFKEWQGYFEHAWSDHLNELRQHRFSEKQNAQNLDDKLNGLLRDYSALLVVRVDLAYAEHKTIEQVDNDLAILRRRIKRSKYADDLLLFVWALEQGERKGYHCHIALVFDERKRTGAWSIAKFFGELWEEVTAGCGSYFNCHDRRHLKRYEERDMVGIGVIFSKVAYQTEMMRSTLAYLARPDKEQYLRVKSSKKMQTFGMSQGKLKE